MRYTGETPQILQDFDRRLRILESSSTSNNVGGWRNAAETWTYLSADAPTFYFTTPGDRTNKYTKGMRVRLVQTTTKYFMITSVNYNAGSNLTTVSVYGGSDYTLTSASIFYPFYSEAKVPEGFPVSPSKWTERTQQYAGLVQLTPSALTWYNIGGLSLVAPIGAWHFYYRGDLSINDAGTNQLDAQITLSTTNNSETDTYLSSSASFKIDVGGAGVSFQYFEVMTTPITKYVGLELSNKTTYYLLERVTAAGIDGLYISRVSLDLVSSYL